MSIFQDVVLAYEGKEYRVKSDDVMLLIEAVEDIITIDELTSSKVKFVKLSRAYGEALRFAGCKINDQQIYVSMFSQDQSIAAAQNAIAGLVSLMIPFDTTPAKKKPAKKKKRST